MRTIEVSDSVYKKLEGLKRYYDDFKYGVGKTERRWIEEHEAFPNRMESSWSEFLNVLWKFTNTSIIKSQKG